MLHILLIKIVGAFFIKRLLTCLAQIVNYILHPTHIFTCYVIIYVSIYLFIYNSNWCKEKFNIFYGVDINNLIHVTLILHNSINFFFYEYFY